LKFENDRIILPLLPPVAGTQAGSRDLATWLDSGADEGNVVYISFGTMIGGASEITEALIPILLKNGKRVLVQACEDPPNPFGSEARVRYERWLDQNAVLAHHLVDGMITHGGAGALQEAIWHAKPLICLPHAWDQYYNSWVIENLKIGVVGDKQRAKSRVYARKLLSRFFSEHAVLSQSIQELSDEARAFEKDFDLDGTFRAMA
jgi:UDP:flavonoid glycosyltransferase YjiC (YdhE family)